jgi:hypothetical protein
MSVRETFDAAKAEAFAGRMLATLNHGSRTAAACRTRSSRASTK